ncbi:MAG TPA: energy transducer TonB [Dokdonella sp.]|uniref:energy transducer TonB family protein n=1 Tax=Dokdonella sp. TaxID=2291710 RepID=UPI002B724C40|nr:energy transducer TonB [Dokdonella sp.]HUD41206.1 energy transducer TonB [Dokdonella sp.]
MSAAARPTKRWGVALAAALAAHGLIAAWLWPRAARPDAAAAAPAAILVELQAASPPPSSAAAATPPQPPAAALTSPPEPAQPRRPEPAPQPLRADAPRPLERPLPQRAAVETATPPPAREAAPAAPTPEHTDAAATSSQAASSPEPDSESAAAITATANPAATPQRGSTQGRPAAEVAWQSRLLGHLEGFRRYPTRALRQRHEGVAYLRFGVDRRGGVHAVRLERSSGSDLLDAEALDVVRRAQPLPAPPPEIEGDPVEVVVPVQFRLRRR